MAVLLASLIPAVRAGRLGVAAVSQLGRIGSRVLAAVIRREEGAVKPQEPSTQTPAAGNPAPSGGRTDTEWTLGKHRSDTKWGNQMRDRGWTKEKITDTIKNGKEYPAPNKVRERIDPTATATRYEKDGHYVVRDDQTKEIIQISGDDFIRPTITK